MKIQNKYVCHANLAEGERLLRLSSRIHKWVNPFHIPPTSKFSNMTSSKKERERDAGIFNRIRDCEIYYRKANICRQCDTNEHGLSTYCPNCQNTHTQNLSSFEQLGNSIGTVYAKNTVFNQAPPVQLALVFFQGLNNPLLIPFGKVLPDGPVVLSLNPFARSGKSLN